MSSSSVVLPQPLGPTTASTSPAAALSETPSSAGCACCAHTTPVGYCEGVEGGTSLQTLPAAVARARRLRSALASVLAMAVIPAAAAPSAIAYFGPYPELGRCVSAHSGNFSRARCVTNVEGTGRFEFLA